MRAFLVLLMLTGVAAAAPCPSGNALLDAAQVAFPPEMRDAPLDLAHVKCAPVRTHAGTRWLISFAVGDGLLLAVVTPAGSVAWTCCGLGAAGSITDVQVADLDGDGTDELLTTERIGATRALGISSVDGQGESIELCQSTWRLVPHKRGSTIEVTGGCSPGTYAWGRAQLVRS